MLPVCLGVAPKKRAAAAKPDVADLKTDKPKGRAAAAVAAKEAEPVETVTKRGRPAKK